MIVEANKGQLQQVILNLVLNSLHAMPHGGDLTIITTGGMLQTAMRVSEKLDAVGFHARVLSMHTLKPIDADAILAAAGDTGALFTLEEHSVIGGLGSAAAEVLAEANIGRIPFKRLGAPSAFSPHIGSQEYMLARHGLNDEGVVHTILETLAVNSAGRSAARTQGF